MIGCLLEQAAAEGGDVRDRDDPDVPAPRFEGFGAAEGGDVDGLEAELGGFGDPAFDLRDGTDLATEAHLAGKADLWRDEEVEVGREHRCDDGQIAGRVGHAEAAGDIQEDILGGQLEAGTLFEHG